MRKKIALACILVLSVTLCLAEGAQKAQPTPSSAKATPSAQAQPVEKAQPTPTAEPASVPVQTKPAAEVSQPAPTPPAVTAAPQPRLNPVTPQRAVEPSDHRPRPRYDRPRNDFRRDWRDRRGGHYPGFLDFRIYHYPYIIPYPVPAYYPVSYPRRDFGVCVVYGGNDIVGSSFATALRDQILASPSLVLVNTIEQAQLEIYIVSADQDLENAGTNSSVSVSYVWFPGSRFLTAQMLFVGASQVSDAAASVVSYASSLMQENR